VTGSPGAGAGAGASPGPLGDELAALFAELRGWLDRHTHPTGSASSSFPSNGAAPDGAGPNGAGPNGGLSACELCPVCRLIGRLSTTLAERPELLSHLAIAASSLATAWRSLLATLLAPPTTETPGAESQTPGAEPETPDSGTERPDPEAQRPGPAAAASHPDRSDRTGPGRARPSEDGAGQGHPPDPARPERRRTRVQRIRVERIDVG